MPQETNLNVSPYFDDFNEDNNFYKVLFKPSYPVQARELTTLQSILQNQIEQFGNSMFKEGSIVIPGETSYDSDVSVVELQGEFGGVEVSTYLKELIGTVVTGQTTGVKAKVEHYLTDIESERGNPTLYIGYLTPGEGEDAPIVFADGENLITESGISLSNVIITSGENFATTIPANSTGNGSIFRIAAGIYFIRGNFVNVTDQLLVLDQYGTTPTYRIGFDILEEFITADDDSSLYDNAQGFNNYGAPGADRLKITATLAKYPLDSTGNDGFIELTQVLDGTIQSLPQGPEFTAIRDAMASRTYETDGDYYIRPFGVDVEECLNNLEGNNGNYLAGEETDEGNTPSDDLMNYIISDGKAYVRGYEVEVTDQIRLDVEKPRTTKRKKNKNIKYETGRNVTLQSISGTPKIGIGNTYTVSLRDQRVGGDSFTSSGDSDWNVAAGQEIGVARMYDFSLKKGGYDTNNLDLNKWNTSFFDVQTYTTINMNRRITLPVPTYVEGRSSGASGYLKESVSDSKTLTLTDVKGKFVKSEYFAFNGISTSGISTGVTQYEFSDTKSVFSPKLDSLGISTFNANMALKGVVNLDQGGITALDVTTGVSSITLPDPNYSVIVKNNDIIKFKSSEYDEPVLARVTKVFSNEITSTELTIVGLATVTGITTGTLPIGTPNNSAKSTLNNIRIQRPRVEDIDDSSYLFTSLPNANISEIDTSESKLIIRRQFSVDIDNNSTSVTLSNKNESFLDYQDQRYTLLRTDGTIEPLTADKVNISTNGKTITFNGLGTTDYGADLVATILKTNLTSKIKLRNRANSLIVDKSIYTGSGLGATTLNNGLVGPGTTTGQYPFGTRVEDELISLNVSDVYRIYGIYEATQPADTPSSPRMSVSSLSGPQGTTSDLILGESVVGSESLAKAAVVNLFNDTTIDIIPLNGENFVEGETLEFEESNITAKFQDLDVRSNNISEYYIFDNGQRNTIYDYSRIQRKSNDKIPSQKIIIYFENAYYDSSDTGDLTTVDSYSSFDYGNVPYFHDVRNGDMLDMRPRVSDYTVVANGRSPFEFSSRNFTSSGNSAENILANDESVFLKSFNYYLPRVDKIYLNGKGEFQIVKGTPRDVPMDPPAVADSIEIGRIFLPPYLYNVEDASISRSNYKRFRMTDIARLETRIANLEDFSTLTLLETDTANMFIPDSTGLNRFKSGFFVDNFSSLSTQDVQSGLKNSIDPQQSFMRASHHTTEIELMIGSTSTLGIGTFSDPYWTTEEPDTMGTLSGENCKLTGDTLTLDYSHVEWKDQQYATRIISVTPYLVKYWKGRLRLNPSVDVWVDQVRLEPKTVKVEGNFSAVMAEQAKINGVDPETGLAPQIWDSWNTTWTGKPEWKPALTAKQSKRYDAPGGAEESAATRKAWRKAMKNGDHTGKHKWIGGSRKYFKNGTIPSKGLYVEAVTVKKEKLGSQIQVKEVWENESMGDEILSTEVAKWMRSRNVEGRGWGFKSFTRLYPFLQGKRMEKWITPKLVEIEMISGVFEPGENISGNMPDFISNGGNLQDEVPEITARICYPSHRSGKINKTSWPGSKGTKYGAKYKGNPYDNGKTKIPNAYSTTSTILNIDTHTLGRLDGNQGDRSGYIRKGMEIVGEKSGAIAKVTNVKLVSDHRGFIKFCFYIPDPHIPGNPRWLTNGPKTFRLTDQKNNKYKPIGIVNTAGNAKYEAKGTVETVQEKIISVKNAVVEEIPLKKTKTELKFTGKYIDPLAQSFACDDENGVFVTKAEVYFQAKDKNDIPVTCQLRTMELGLPTSVILPFSSVDIDPDDIVLTNNATKPTTIEFEAPVYLEGGKEYCIVLLSNSTEYKVFISRMGDNDVRFKDEETGDRVRVNTQPTLGSLFKSQNASTWTPSQYEDLTFKLYRAKFVKDGVINFYNPKRGMMGENRNSHVQRLLPGAIHSVARKLRLGLTNGGIGMGASFTAMKEGTTIRQYINVGAGSSTPTGKFVGVAGSASGTMEISVPGVGYVPEVGEQQYTNVSLTNITGTGKNGTANIYIKNGVAIAATISNGGYGYQAGDEVTASIGSSALGRNLRLGIGTLSSFNEIILDQVQGTWFTGAGSTMVVTDVGGSEYELLESWTTTGVEVPSKIDNIEVVNDGTYIRVSQKNHGLHSPGSLGSIWGVHVEKGGTTKLAANYGLDDTGSISLVDASKFVDFEGLPVSATNPGLIRCRHELMAYRGVSNNKLTGITRFVNIGNRSWLKKPLRKNHNVYKFEFNGVSCARISMWRHPIILNDDPNKPVEYPLGLDYWWCKVNMSDFRNLRGVGKITDRSENQTTLPPLYLTETSNSYPSHRVYGSRNLQFEAITPQVAMSNPSSCSVSGRIKTISATSVSGTEAAYVEQEYEGVQLNETNFLDTPRMIASRINEVRNLKDNEGIAGEKSFDLLLDLNRGDDDRLSPVIDITRVSCILTSNRINSVIDDYSTDWKVKTLKEDPSECTYVSTRLTLETPATSIKLMLDSYVNINSDIRAFYYISNNEEEEPIFTPFPGYENRNSFGVSKDPTANDGTSDNFIPKDPDIVSSSPDLTSYTFSVNELPEFKYYKVKLVMTSTSQASVPMVRSLRAIALA